MLKLMHYLRPYKIPIAIVLCLITVQSLAELYLPTLMAIIVDTGIINQDIPFIYKIGGVMLLVAALGTICSIGASYYSAKVSMSFGKDLRYKVFSHVESFSLQEFEQIGTSSLITRTTNDITQVQQVVNMILRMMVTAPIMAVGGLLMAYLQDPDLSKIFLAAIPILFMVILLIIWKGIPLFKLVQVRLDHVNRVLRENLTGVRVIRSFNRINHEKKRFQHANAELTDTSIKVNKIMATLMPALMLIMNYTVISIIWFGAIRIDDGDMQVGGLMAFIQYAMQIMFSMIMFSMMFVMIPRASASATRIYEVLQMKPTMEETTKAIKTHEKGTIEFRNVTFSYPGAEVPALKDLSFQVKPGETTAIIGGTGTGKTTLLKLIPRFYELDSGMILVNGVNIKDMTLDDLRAKIGIVPQKAVLFTGTVKENICFGTEDATNEDVIHAATIAQAHDFVLNMQDGFESMVSQGGSNLSGGQKQRLAIARALLRKPEIYLFDDSFSALDYSTDAKLRAALKEETTQSAVLIVAQRVATVMNADCIIVLDAGCVAGIGTHQELIRICKVYQEIVSSQLSEEELA